MMPELILIRHSAVDIDPARPSREWQLSADGQARCHQLAPGLAAFQPAHIFTSHEQKAIETGRILAQNLGMTSTAVPGLHEHDRVGVPIFADSKDFQTAVARLFTRPDELVFGNETANQALKRFDTAVHRLIKAHPGQTIAIVTHGTALTLFVAKHNPINPTKFWQNLTLPCLIHISLPDLKLKEKITL